MLIDMLLGTLTFIMDGIFCITLIVLGIFEITETLMLLGKVLTMLITLGRFTELVITILLGKFGTSSKVITLGIGYGLMMLIVLGTTIGPNGPISKQGKTIGGNWKLLGTSFTTARSKLGKSGIGGTIIGKVCCPTIVCCETSSTLNLSALVCKLSHASVSTVTTGSILLFGG